MAAKPKPQVTQENQREAWLLRQKCWTEARIAEKLGIAQSSVHRMLERENQRLADIFKERADYLKAEQTAQLEYIADEAMQAWKRSKEDAELKRTVAKRLGAKEGKGASKPETPGGAEVPGMYLDRDGEEVDSETAAEMLADQILRGRSDGLTIVEETTTSEARGQSGDPRFLDAAMKAMSEVRDIWGANAPKQTKAELTGKNGESLPIFAYEIVAPVNGDRVSREDAPREAPL